jgi:uncharacterized protein DUF3159
VTDPPQDRKVTFDRHMVLDQLGGWRGMVDATLPTAAFIVGNGVGGLRPGIWAAVAAAVLVFVLRLARRQSVQQGVSGLFAVAVAVVIAARSGEARDFFALGLIRNAGIGVVLLGSVLVRWPLAGVVAEFLAPSHLGSLAHHDLSSLRGRLTRRRQSSRQVEDPPVRAAGPDAEPDHPWREDRVMLRAYSWLTVLWAATFLARVGVQGVLYLHSGDGDVDALGITSLLMGLPLTAVALGVTLWVVARLHRHRTGADGAAAGRPDEEERPAA